MNDDVRQLRIELDAQRRLADAWRRLAMARLAHTSTTWSDPTHETTRAELDAAYQALVAIGINPWSGERIDGEEPR